MMSTDFALNHATRKEAIKVDVLRLELIARRELRQDGQAVSLESWLLVGRNGLLRDSLTLPANKSTRRFGNAENGNVLIRMPLPPISSTRSIPGAAVRFRQVGISLIPS